MSEQLRTVAWYDRNPTQIRYNLSSTIAPHAKQTWADYTVPKDRIGVINLLYMSLLRETAATKVGAYTQMYGEYKVKEGIIYGFVYANLSKANNVGDRAQIDVGTNVFIPAGDNLAIYSMDDSPDGTVKYDMTVAGTEFDAYPIERPPFQPKLPEEDVQAPIIEKPWWKQILGWP